MATKGQMKPTSWQGEFKGVPGRREQPNQWPRTYSCIQYSKRPDLQKKSRKKCSIVGTIIKLAKKHRDRAKRIKIQNRHNNSINSNINLDLGFSEIKDRITVPNPLKSSIKIFAEKSMNQTASNLNVESPSARSKLSTNWSNHEPNDTIQLPDFSENQITRENIISVALAKDIFLSLDHRLSAAMHWHAAYAAVDLSRVTRGEDTGQWVTVWVTVSHGPVLPPLKHYSK